MSTGELLYLPEQEVTEPNLARRTDQQVGRVRVIRVETLLQQTFRDVAVRQQTYRHLATETTLISPPLSSTTQVSRCQDDICDFIGSMMTEVVRGDYWSYKTCKAPVESSPPTNKHPPLYRPDALPVAQITFHELAHPNLTEGLPTLSLSTKASVYLWEQVVKPFIRPLTPVPRIQQANNNKNKYYKSKKPTTHKLNKSITV